MFLDQNADQEELIKFLNKAGWDAGQIAAHLNNFSLMTGGKIWTAKEVRQKLYQQKKEGNT